MDGKLPDDPNILMSLINLKLRNEYPEGLEALCDDMNISSDKLQKKLQTAGYEYIPSVNQFR